MLEQRKIQAPTSQMLLSACSFYFESFTYILHQIPDSMPQLAQMNSRSTSNNRPQEYTEKQLLVHPRVKLGWCISILYFSSRIRIYLSPLPSAYSIPSFCNRLFAILPTSATALSNSTFHSSSVIRRGMMLSIDG